MPEKPELKQYGDLNAADFQTYPVWVQCHTMDYEAPWYSETDEETFRPWLENLPVDPGEGMFLVRARFAFPDGSDGWGFVTPQFGESADELRDLAVLQPTLFLGERQLGFWTGIRTRSEEELRQVYERLGRSSSEVFPIRFSMQAGLAAGRGDGEVPGFCSIPDFRNVQVDR